MIEIPKSTKGQILISNSSIVQDFFHKTIVFMVDHDEDGAFGLVLNKPTNQTILQLIKNIPSSKHNDDLVYSGGPVDNFFVSVLHNKKNSLDPGVEVIPGLFMARSFETLVEILESKDVDFKIFQGYSGWSAGQLESEFKKLSWVAYKADPDFILKQDGSEESWKQALRNKGGIYRYFVDHTKDPMLN